MQVISRERYGSLFVPAVFMALVSLIPWIDIVFQGSRGILIDREVYIYKIIHRESVFDYFQFDTYLSYFTSEYSWEFLTRMLQDGVLPLHYEAVFQIISMFFLIMAGVVVYRRCGFLPLIFLASPLIFELAYSQLRSALAVSFLFIAYVFFPRKNYIAIAICLFAATIHTTMLIFLAVYLLCLATSDKGGYFSRWPISARVAMILGAGVVVGLVVGPLRETLLIMLGDRRADDYLDLSSSPLYLSFWVALLGMLLFNYRDTLKDVEGRFSIFILSLVAVNIFTGGYSLRFLAIGYPFIITTVMTSRPSVRLFAVPGMLLYLLIQWAYYISNVSG